MLMCWIIWFSRMIYNVCVLCPFCKEFLLKSNKNHGNERMGERIYSIFHGAIYGWGCIHQNQPTWQVQVVGTGQVQVHGSRLPAFRWGRTVVDKTEGQILVEWLWRMFSGMVKLPLPCVTSSPLILLQLPCLTSRQAQELVLMLDLSRFRFTC